MAVTIRRLFDADIFDSDIFDCDFYEEYIMGKCVISRPDHTSLSTTTLSYGGWNSDFPLNNLKDPLVSKKARSTDAQTSNTTFRMDLGSSKTVRFFSVIGHNMIYGATVRLRVFPTNAYSGTPDYDSTALDIYPNSWPANYADWDSDGYWLGNSPASDFIPRPTYWFYLPANQAAQYIQIDFNDPNNTIGYVEIGRFFLGSATLVPNIMLAYGASVSWADDSTKQKSLGGVNYYDTRPARKIITGTFESLTLDEGMSMWELQRRVGIHGEVFFIFDYDDTDILYKQRSMLCTFSAVNPIDFPYMDAMSNAFQLEEII